ncbi:glycoside hydrolase family 35 protein [Pseudocercospora fijiensis CIRAD86]|uniref:beta-galactosidase n=1 Tax=Pseudocercospora fijiensis (strain CIRAD86) TaxID=383855 RepID=M2ZIV7_PSEFD|nr:glycoside hydrolase family 35 protein [Pseudocercospora fijiensis CIRAD86]EME79049.1 glycoside hydrolase family 35 protein [Pseudocercospora fijiensis CIRAD86]
MLEVLVWLLCVACLVFSIDDGLTKAVTWDKYSLMINGSRVFIQAGEFHYERLPVPEMWRDVLQKFKANGLNAVSIYFFWSYHSSGPGVFDFESPGKDIQKLFDMCKEIGLWVMARPGPYCNAETNGGGLALYGSDGSFGKLRTSDETYHQAWLPWVKAVGSIIAKNQITKGGPVILYQIENELQEIPHEVNNTLVLYMEQVESASRDVGIEVPLYSNEKGMRSQSWSTDYQDVGGSVNIYGLDSYPGSLSCTNPDAGFKVVRTYYQWFQNYSFSQPSLMPEFEAGYFQPWGGSFYDSCTAMHDPQFADVYYKTNIGQRTTMQSLYLAFGGTNWGNLAAPVVYTSYDYSAPLNEKREVTTKFKQTKLIAFFTRVSSDLLKTEMESNGTGNAVSTNDVWTWVLRNPDTQAGFYVLQNANTSSRATIAFDVYLNTSEGNATVKGMELKGRQSKIVTTDYHFGVNRTMLFCTADVLTWVILGDTTMLVLYLDVGQTADFTLDTKAKHKVFGDNKLVSDANDHGTYTRYSYTQKAGSTIVRFDDDLTVWLLDTETAWNFYAIPLSTDPFASPNHQILALGPYNIRNASIQGSTIALVGDNENTTSLEVFAGPDVGLISWNDQNLATTMTEYGSLKATARGCDAKPSLPSLFWKAADSLPELSTSFDDSSWKICNKTTTRSPVAPLTLPVLFSSDYGYFAGIKIYRGSFTSRLARSANITIQGGRAAGFTAWLNGISVGYTVGNATSPSPASALLDFSNATLSDQNMLTVVTDYTGHDQTSTGPAGVENPRGILGAWLYDGDGNELPFSTWKIRGSALDENPKLDPVRGSMNEDGLHGTRLGWHLPGFEANGPEWTNEQPSVGLSKSGVRWYVSNFTLDFPHEIDAPVSFNLEAAGGTIASIELFVNGYQFGKSLPHFGPQTRFPVPPGVINHCGNNQIALVIWAMTDAGAKLTKAELVVDRTYRTGFDFNQDWTQLQPGWTPERIQDA